MKPGKPFTVSGIPLYTLAFVAPIILYMGVMLLCRITPFGTRTLLVWDANSQYAAFLAEWRRVILGQADPFYTLHMVLGNGSTGLVSYYLASPWNAVFAMFSETALPLAYSAVVLIKIGLAGLCMMAYLRYTCHMNVKGLLFAVTYALSGFVAVYGWSVMWMDGVAALPLIMLGLRKLSRKENPVTYILTLAYALFCNYYIGFMICLFSVLYIVCMAMENRAVLRRAWVFMGASVLAAGLAAVMLVPAYVAISSGYKMFDLSDVTLSRVSSLFSIMTKAYTGAVSVEQIRYGQPNYYIGIPLLALALGYLLNPSVPLRRRLYAVVLPGLLLVSFIIKPLYLLWHGFEFPSGFPARFSFLFSFVLIELAAQGYLHMPRPATAVYRRRMLCLGVGMVAFTAIAFQQDVEPYLAFETVVFDVFAFLVTCLVVVRPSATRYRRAACAALCALQLAGLGINAYMGYHRLDTLAGMTTDRYADFITANSGYLRRIETADTQRDGVYRLEKNYRLSENDAMALGYPGLSHYSSAPYPLVTRMADRLGLYHSYLRVIYGAGTTPVLESLLGVKYILYRTGASLESLPPEYVPLWTEGDVTAYQNPYALPLAMLVPAAGAVNLDTGNPFAAQNTVLSDLVGEPVQAFTPLDVPVTSDQEGFLYATVPASAGQQVYMLSSGSYYYFNDMPGQDSTLFQGCVRLPAAAADTAYTLKMWSSTGAKPQFAAFNMDALRRAYALLKTRAYEVQSDTASHLRVRVTADAQHPQLVLSIPYDKGWSAWVDGERQAVTSRFDAFLAVAVTPGPHEVELRYLPTGILAGAAISAGSALLLGLWMLLRLGPVRRRREGR